MKWGTISNLIVAIMPVVLSVLLAHATWVTSEVYAAKYTMLTADDGRQILDDAAAFTDDRTQGLLAEITMLRRSVAVLQTQSAEILATVRMLTDQAHSENSFEKFQDSG